MDQNIHPSYCTTVPSGQTAVDIFKGAWSSAFPQHSGIVAGKSSRFNDFRVTWVGQELGSLEHRSVLELGPYEAYNTFQLSQLGAHPITAVEGSNINYLKCLIAKETLGIRAKFLHGDIRAYVESTTEAYDVCWLSGVLYHQLDPLKLLKAVARICTHAYIWTHYFDERIPNNPSRYPLFDSRRDVERDVDGYRCVHHYRSYGFRSGGPPILFSGGSSPFSYWLAKDDILGYLDTLGFTKVTVGGVNVDHDAGPTISLVATKPQTSVAGTSSGIATSA